MRQKLSLNDIQKKLLIHSGSVILDESTYINTQTKACFIDKDYGEWWAYPVNVFRGCRHPKRSALLFSKKKTFPFNEIEDKLEKICGNTVVIKKETYINTQTKACFIDKDYGEWWAYPYNVLYNKHGHPKRGKEKWIKSARISVDEIEEKIKKVHGNELCLVRKTYVDTQIKCKFIDKDYGEFWAKPNNIIFNKNGHPARGKIRQIKSRTTSVELILKKLRLIHDDQVSLDVKTYKNVNTKARFIDKDYGEWWARPSAVIYQKTSHPLRGLEKSRKTCLKKYGVEHISKCKEFLRRMASSRSRFYTLIHWKTEEKVVCQGSWEVKVVEYFNENKINFEWQNEVLQMPDKRTYRPDCYLIDEDKWIEIKGYFWDDAEEKWKWFHEKYPNSELWNEEILKNKGIL